MTTSTRSYEEFVASRVKWLPTWKEDVLHACVGIAGEAIEYFQALGNGNEGEELGDLYFYLEHCHLAFGRANISTDLSPVEYKVPDADSDLDRMLYISGDILDLAKKVWVYNKPVDQLPFWYALEALEDTLASLAHAWGGSEKVKAANVAKLEKRYPTGYSDAAAQARADKPQGE